MVPAIRRCIVIGGAFVLAACGGDSNNGEISGSADVDLHSAQSITVYARSNRVNGESAQVSVLVNGQALSPQLIEIDGNSKINPYFFDSDEPIHSGDQVDVVFANGGDAAGHGADVDPRALTVDSVTVNGTGLAPTDAVIDQGDGIAALDGKNVMPGQAEMTVSGAMRFSAPEPPSDDSDTGLEQDESGIRLAGTRWCTGRPDQNLDAAKRSFRDRCGEPYNDQKGHRCDYKSDGFHCNGQVGANSPSSGESSPPASPRKPSAGSYCYGAPSRNQTTAKRNFRSRCGETWNDQIGHVCEWKSDGWHCGGKLRGNIGPSAPRSVKGTFWARSVIHLQWTRPISSRSPVRYYKVFRNGRYIAKVSRTEYVDRRAPSSAKYQIVAVDRKNNVSPSSDEWDRRITARQGERNMGFKSTYYGSSNQTTRKATGMTTLSPNGSTTSGAVITDGNGNRLGTATQSYDPATDTTTTVFDPDYGSKTLHSQRGVNPTKFAPGLGPAAFQRGFPPKPTRKPPSNNGGDNNPGTKPGTQPPRPSLPISPPPGGTCKLLKRPTC